jgi:short-subunit dehydrogenase
MAHNHAVIEPGMTALVTGASSGIGEQFARQLADRGVNLVLVARNRQRLEDLAADLRQRHNDLTASVYPADLAETTGASQLAATLEANGVMVDLLINNAGTGLYANFIEQDLGAITNEIQLDCLSLVELTRQFLPGMVTRHRGGIINVASTSAFQPIPTMAVYAASKAFVLSFTEAVWAETKASGVRVMALCPGPTETRFFDNASSTKKFLTRGRQSPGHVAGFALQKFTTRRNPTVIPGAANHILASGYRITPRPLMTRVSELYLRAG